MGLLQADIDDSLVDGTLHEGRVDSDNGLLAGKRKRACHANGMLLGYADIEETLGVGLRESGKPRAARHRRRNGDN